ncbi:hypothetical protein EXIGLDRAFT_700824 [Exidia glandulosa HHB12029]|uniref:Uncharacterized protein n=1 Tax=Exidia glandulosa HHB12029 TaxID=1314781 RepID=A0A165DA12_EXIGL|nr:hypothetical protein EXIGLDRAFT_700824 [Exidia glandulosa HHB12029]
MLCDIPLAAFDTTYAAIYRGQSLFFPSGTVDTVRLRDGLAELVNSTPILAGTLQYDTSRPGGWLKVGAPWWSADEILNIVDNTSRVDYATAPILWYFSEEALAALKARANVDGNVGISTYVALCAFIWQRVVAASPAEDPNMPVNMLNAVDSRRRMNPTIPSNWLGNAVSIAHARSTARELLSAPLSRTAQLIRTSIEDMTAARILDAVALLHRQPDLAMSPALAFSTWARLDTYELDWGTAFGGTRCERIRVYWAPPAGMVFIFPMGANGPSDKGVEVMLHLTPEDAAVLDKDPTFAKYASKVY